MHIGGIEPKNVFKVVRYGTDNNSLNINVVKYFLYEFFKDVRGLLAEDWVSYGVTIGKKGEEINPWNIISIVKDEDIMKDLQEKICDENDIKWMVCVLLSSSKLMGSTIDTYIDVLKTRILAQMKLLGCRLGAFTPKNLYETWILDDSYNKMVSAIDMFFNRFPTHQDSCMRICTLCSRFKDCSGLLSVFY